MARLSKTLPHFEPEELMVVLERLPVESKNIDPILGNRLLKTLHYYLKNGLSLPQQFREYWSDCFDRIHDGKDIESALNIKVPPKRGTPSDRDIAYYVAYPYVVAFFQHLKKSKTTKEAVEEIKKEADEKAKNGLPHILDCYACRRVKKDSLEDFLEKGLYLPAFIAMEYKISIGDFDTSKGKESSYQARTWAVEHFLLKEDTYNAYLKEYLEGEGQEIRNEWGEELLLLRYAQRAYDDKVPGREEFLTLDRVLHDFQVIGSNERISTILPPEE